MIKIYDYIRKKQPEFLLLTMLLLVFLILKQSNYLAFLEFNLREIVFLFWAIVIFILKLSSRESLVIGFICLILCSFFMFLKIEGWIIRVGGYIYYFFLVGVVQLWFEYFRNRIKD